jgi:hypothetical protein
MMESPCNAGISSLMIYFPNYSWRAERANMSIDTDPQQQEAALPLVLVVRSSSR